MLAKLLLALCAVSATSLGLAIGGRRCNAHLVRPAPTLSVKMVAPTVGTSTAPEKTNTVSAKLGLDAGMLRASRVAGDAAIAGAEAGAKQFAEQFEPTIFLFGGACIFTAGFFVPPTAARGAGMVIGLLGLSFMCYGAYVKHALHAKDAASPGPAASGLDPHQMPSRDKGGTKT